MVIHEVPITNVIKLPTGKSGSTMEGTNGKTTHMVTHSTNITHHPCTHMGAESAHMTGQTRRLPYVHPRRRIRRRRHGQA